MTLYVRHPGPGDMRGEGQWGVFNGDKDDWDYLTKTGYLPVGWTTDAGIEAVSYGRDGFVVPAYNNPDYTERQLSSLIEQMGGSDA